MPLYGEGINWARTIILVREDMGYWNRVVSSHERMSKDFPTGEEGLWAVRFLRSFFEQMGCEQLPPTHPLHNRLSVGFEPNYLWLIQYTRKLLTASSLSGFEQVARRLIDPREYLAAQNEIDFALKLHLAGLHASFPSVSSQPTPDLVLRLGSDIMKIEVSSLHPPDEETRVHMLFDRILTLTLQQRVVSGGFVSKIPSPTKVEEVIDRVKESIARVKETGKKEKLNVKGVATIYLAPPDKVDQIPDECRSSYHIIKPYRKPIEYQIQGKIEKKSKQLFEDNELGLLVLHTQMIDRKTVSQLFKNDRDDIAVMLASYPKLLGLVLTVPHLGMEVVSATKSEALQSEYKDNKVFLESEAGVYRYESTIVWKNLHADRNFPKEILGALKNYPSNLTNLVCARE
jgi:hypothetical protein